MSDHDSQHTESRASGTTVPVAFVDASAIVALVDRNEETHAAAVAAYNDLVAGDYRLFTTNQVVAETLELLSATVGAEIARQWLRDLRLPIYHVTEPDEQRALALVVNSRNPQGLSWADATSLVVMERFGISDAFAVDPGFLSEQV